MKPKILLVEDTRTGKSRALRLLEKCFDVIAVRNPATARNCLAGPNGYAAVVANLSLESMPDGEDGSEVGLRLIRDLRAEHSNLVLVAWTKQSEKYQDKAVSAGASLVISKYIGDEDMAERILGLLPTPA